MTVIAYLAHPIGSIRSPREHNILNAKQWLRFLVEHTDVAVCCPWLPYVEMLDETNRERGIRDDLAILERCDLIITCGGMLSPGMQGEVLHGDKLGIPTVHFVPVGYSAPTMLDSACRKALRELDTQIQRILANREAMKAL